MKKNILIITVVSAVLILGIITAFLLKGRTTPGVIPEIEEERGSLIETSLEQRPYVTLTPRTDGKEFTLDISRIDNAQIIEYELIYLSQGLSRGVIGSIDLDGESEISRKLLLGTCSKDVCKYDEGIEEGTLTLRFRSSEGTRKFVTDFHLQQGDDKLTSLDGNFSLTGKINKSAFYITMLTVGLPKAIEKDIIVGPYGIFTSGRTTISSAEVAFNLEEEKDEVKLYSWGTKGWSEEDNIVDGKEVSASIANLGTFIITTP